MYTALETTIDWLVRSFNKFQLIDLHSFLQTQSSTSNEAHIHTARSESRIPKLFSEPASIRSPLPTGLFHPQNSIQSTLCNIECPLRFITQSPNTSLCEFPSKYLQYERSERRLAARNSPRTQQQNHAKEGQFHFPNHAPKLQLHSIVRSNPKFPGLRPRTSSHKQKSNAPCKKQKKKQNQPSHHPGNAGRTYKALGHIPLCTIYIYTGARNPAFHAILVKRRLQEGPACSVGQLRVQQPRVYRSPSPSFPCPLRGNCRAWTFRARAS